MDFNSSGVTLFWAHIGNLYDQTRMKWLSVNEVNYMNKSRGGVQIKPAV